MLTLMCQIVSLHPRCTPGLWQSGRFPRSQARRAGLSGAVSVPKQRTWSPTVAVSYRLVCSSGSPAAALGPACRELGASDVGPGAAFSGRRPERGRGSQGEGGVNLGHSGPDGGAVLPVSLPEVLVSLRCEFLGLAIVIGTRYRSSRWDRCPHWSHTCRSACSCPTRSVRKSGKHWREEGPGAIDSAGWWKSVTVSGGQRPGPGAGLLCCTRAGRP